MKSLNLLTACALATMLITGCSDDGVGETDRPDAVDGPVTFRLGMGVVTQAPPASRALAHEQGFDYENAIDDAVIIVYDTPLNATGGSIVYMKYVSSLTKDATHNSTAITPVSYDASGNATTWDAGFSTVNRYAFELGEGPGEKLEDGKTYYMVALANVADLAYGTNLKDFYNLNDAPIKDLDDLRGYVYKGPICTAAGYTDNKAGYTNRADGGSYPDNKRFAMSSIGEVKFTYNKADIKDGVYTLPDVYVQRLAARIDLIFGNKGTKIADLADSNYDYVILDAPGDYPYDNNNVAVYFPIYDAEKGSRISNAVLALTQIHISDMADDYTGEYLFERSDYNGVSTIFGNEGFDTETGYATRFVYSPPFRDEHGKEFAEGTDESHHSHSSLFPNKGGSWTNETGTTETWDGLLGDANRIRTLSNGTQYAILGYVRENTFRTHSDKNNYTEVFLAGLSNISNNHFEGAPSGTVGKFVTAAGAIPVRHSTGVLDTTKPLAYAIVRNTIYRIRIKFFAKGETVYARYYYYGTKFDGSDDKDNPKENKYTDIPFHNYILEGDGKQPND